MFEKVNMAHPDKVADRIAGAIVDLAYRKAQDPRVAVEVLIGHGECNIIAETSVHFMRKEIKRIVARICNDKVRVRYKEVPQDRHLAKNQEYGIKCGDNGIFKGVPVTVEQIWLSRLARELYSEYHTDGKYIVDGNKTIVCQSNASENDIRKYLPHVMRYNETALINPLGYWTGGTTVDSGATNRKLGSDMGDSVTGGGLHGKDLSKADVSVNIYAWLKAQKTKKVVELSCAIGDATIDGKPYAEIVEAARKYINTIGGFEKFAEWGLI